MPFERWPAHLALAAALLAALSFSGCGRKGELDLPPDAAGNPQVPAPVASDPTSPSVYPPPPPGRPTARNGFDIYGNPVAPPGEKKDFILDPLLD